MESNFIQANLFGNNLELHKKLIKGNKEYKIKKYYKISIFIRSL